jgi:glycerol-3-phosphate dehydrogenase (NAD(P)+)
VLKVGILGSGSWGRALAVLCAEAGSQPFLGYKNILPRGFKGSTSLSYVAKESDLVLIAVPPSKIRSVVREAKLGPQNHVVIAARGLEPQSNAWLSSVVLEESSALRVGALAGPVLADEVINRRPTAMVVGSQYDEIGRRTQDALHSVQCRVYSTNDILGVELASAMNKGIGIALGIVDGLKQGVGVRGVVITRGVAESTRLGKKLGAKEHTFAGLAGVGDLVSCGLLSSHQGYAAGLKLAKGVPCPESLVQELQSLVTLAQHHQVNIPLTKGILAIAMGKIKAQLALDKLMRRAATEE